VAVQAVAGCEVCFPGLEGIALCRLIHADADNGVDGREAGDVGALDAILQPGSGVGALELEKRRDVGVDGAAVDGGEEGPDTGEESIDKGL
jgi:hypothetical protein